MIILITTCITNKCIKYHYIKKYLLFKRSYTRIILYYTKNKHSIGIYYNIGIVLIVGKRNTLYSMTNGCDSTIYFGNKIMFFSTSRK